MKFVYTNSELTFKKVHFRVLYAKRYATATNDIKAMVEANPLLIFGRVAGWDLPIPFLFLVICWFLFEVYIEEEAEHQNLGLDPRSEYSDLEFQILDIAIYYIPGPSFI